MAFALNGEAGSTWIVSTVSVVSNSTKKQLGWVISNHYFNLPLPLELLWKPLRTAAVGTLCPMIEWFPVSMLSIIKWSERLFRGLCTRPVKQRCRTVSLSLIMARLNNILRHDSQRLSLFVMICKLISNWLQQSIVFHELVWLSFSWPIGGRGNPPQTHTGNSHLFTYFSFFM